MNIRWSTFASAEDNAPKPHEGEWTELSKLLTTRHFPPASGHLKGLKKGMPAFSGTIFRENSFRGRESAQTIHLFAFDFDNATEVPTGEFFDERKTRPKMEKVRSKVMADPEEITQLLRDKNITFRAYTTWSSRDDWRRFRLVVPLRGPLTASIWERATEVAIEQLGLGPWRLAIDLRVLRDTARLHFLPGTEEGFEVSFWSHDGDWLQIDAGVAEVAAVPPLPKTDYTRARVQEETDYSRFGIEIETLQLSLLLEALGCVLGRPRELLDGGLKRRTTCPWGAEHSHGPDGDDAVVMETPGKWPSWACAHSVHAHMGLYDVLDLATVQGIDLRDYAEIRPRNAEEMIQMLGDQPSMRDIHRALQMIASCKSNLEKDPLLQALRRRSGISMSALRMELKSMERDPNSEDRTADTGRRIVEAMLDKYFASGEHLLQSPDKSWWSYVGTHWRRMPNENVLRHYLLQAIKDEKLDPKEKESVVLDSAFRILSALQAKEQDLLRLSSVPPRVVNCQNGELWIDEDGNTTLRSHQANSYLTYVLNVDYDPRAEAPRFQQALLDTFSLASDPKDMVRHIEEFFGYAIQPRRGYKTWWLLQGSGDNGKTALIQTLQKLMSPESVYPTVIADANKNEHSRAALAGKLLLLDDDVPTGTMLPDGFLKQVSEDKLLSGRHLYSGHFDFLCTVLPVMLCNNWPSTRDLSQATQKRAMIVPFARKFRPGVDPNPYPGIWKDEMSGVLNMALSGYRRLQQRGYFKDPSDCQRAKQSFFTAANSVYGFAETCERAANLRTPSSEVYKAYQIWARGEGHYSLVRKGELERDLTSLGFDVVIDSHLRQKVVVGIRVPALAEAF